MIRNFILLLSLFYGCLAQTQVQTIGGLYTKNVTFAYRNSPFRVNRDITVDNGATVTIQTGVKMLFDPGIGMIIKGSLYAVGNSRSRIEFLPYHQGDSAYDDSPPTFRLVDGESTREGRLQMFYREKWRSVCTQNTNWTRTDFVTTCRSMGFSGGGFWKWFQRNNDTYPLVMPKPGCTGNITHLQNCPGFIDTRGISLSENLCQGEDDIGIYCWGPPSYGGWERNWKGVQFVNSPFIYVTSDPDNIAVHKQSLSRLEYVDILFAGYNGFTKNSTAAILSQGTPPFMNDITIQYSARDGIHIYEPDAPVLIANSTITRCRGHAIRIDNTTDGRVFINETRIMYNFGDGVRYRHKIGSHLQVVTNNQLRRQIPYWQEEKPIVDFCLKHDIPNDAYFPYFVEAVLRNGTYVGGTVVPCHLTFAMPQSLDYIYNLQFIEMENRNTDETRTHLLICDSSDTNSCGRTHYKLPIVSGIIPQTVQLSNTGAVIWLGILHEGAERDIVHADVKLKLRIFATVHNSALYGLNITNSRIEHNLGRGVYAQDVRDRTVITNVTLNHNQYIAGLQIDGGAGDIWINATNIQGNWGDGINISYAGGSTVVNGTIIRDNHLRAAAFHQNDTGPFLPLRQTIEFKGRSATATSFLPTKISNNRWGAILVGNFCANHLYPLPAPQVILSYIELNGNQYHPAFEYHSCQRDNQPITTVDVTGSRCTFSSGLCIRLQPAVNVKVNIFDNHFLNNNRSVMIIRNRQHPQLKHLPAQVTISKNQFKFNKGPFIVNIGLNEDAPNQSMLFNLQNELRENEVFNPYPHLNPRTNPYATVIVSSSNVILRRNCFRNFLSKYEMATDLPEHAKWIDARENNWGSPEPREFLPKIFDQFNRYSLASIDVDPFAATCNSQNSFITKIQAIYRAFRTPLEPNVLGGTIYENDDLSFGTYVVKDDLHIIPGAKLGIYSGTTLEFENGVGMLVQGELTRLGSHNSPVTFTRKEFTLPTMRNMRLVGENGNQDVTEGRLEVFVDDRWGTVCNRSWTVDLAMKACHQMGMVLDPEFLENWTVFPDPGTLEIVMDNIRCEEFEWDITTCRHDGISQNVNLGCAVEDVVGLRCMEPHWAGVRYSLLANPPSATGQGSMNNWIIEKAGLFDYTLPEFNAGLQIDWNYHSFNKLTLRDNFWTGMDIVYNDLIKKPTIYNSEFLNNRRHGLRLRSVGLTVTNARIENNENAGVRYNPIINHNLQRDVVTWLVKRNLQQMQANFVYVIPSSKITTLYLRPGLEQRKFLFANYTDDCPLELTQPCRFNMQVSVQNLQAGLSSRIGVQIVNRPANDSDETIIFDTGRKQYDVRNEFDLIQFPLISELSTLSLQYKRSYGRPQIVVLLIIFTSNQYLDRFVHIHESKITNNQYAVSTLHYSNFSHWDRSHINRWEHETLWFQKCNFENNKQAVIWVNGPLQDVHHSSPIASIQYKVDNCSITNNNGSIIETHRDLHSSANIFQWNIWSCTFQNNVNSGISVQLPDTYNMLAARTHSFNVTENRFWTNNNFMFELSGYTAFVNISSNNFTENRAREKHGIILIRGMEKHLVLEKNRFKFNKGQWIIKYDIQSQAIRTQNPLPAHIQYNYLDQNHFVGSPDNLIGNYPRSFGVGMFGIQKVEIHYNRFRNPLLDFECVVGLKGALVTDTANITYNWWGVRTDPEIRQRIFDFDDWNIYALADYSKYYVAEENFVDWYWKPTDGQVGTMTYEDPSIYDLKGRLFKSVTLERVRRKWNDFPYHYKPDQPYIITKDVTIMPGATLTISKGVEIHMYPNVRILVLGSLRAEGTFQEPVRLLPINTTELAQINQLRMRLKSPAQLRKKRDIVYRQFPFLRRQDSFYQTFKSYLVDGNEENSGFLEIWNSTTGEMVPICDRQFTKRNAEVVCREKGFETRNAYYWIGARWNYDPRIKLVRSYSEPRQCFGDEERLSDCDLRMNGDRNLWYCTDAENFVFIHCGKSKSLSDKYIGHWGGIVFGAPNLEQSLDGSQRSQQDSILKHVEIVGAGYSDKDSGGALELVFQTPTLQSVNVTNSSMHGIQIIAPRYQVQLANLNVTDNNGVGVNIISLNLQSSNSPSGRPLRNLTIPYHIFGFLDLCSVGKEVIVNNRILVFFKYDSYPVDCVKYFKSNARNRKLGFRFLLVNLYTWIDFAGRPDIVSFYNDRFFTDANHIATVRHNSTNIGDTVESSTNILGVHLRANAADGSYGLIAEISALPAAPDSARVQQVTITDSRIQSNDRGAVKYTSAGESSPEFVMDRCYIASNGYKVWNNFSTSDVAVDLDLHNTQSLRFQNSMLWKNQGGLKVRAQSTSSVAALEGLIKNSAFAQNENFEILSLEGLDFQKIYVLNNYFGKNRARYHDIVFVDKTTVNFTGNTFYNNTGTHIVDLTGYPQVRTEYQLFQHNRLYDNIALGHGFQFPERYGYLPEYKTSLARIKRQSKRSKRQAPTQIVLLDDETSFDWFAHVGAETERYRSTILAGSRRQQYSNNYFNNPLNDFELTTVNQTDLSVNSEPLDARNNFWGSPGTEGVAAGKIRDQQDYPYLVKVDYKPIIETNTSILDGSCPGGWFQAGAEEFKSCFLFFGGVMPFNDAVQYCQDQGGFMPYFRSSDSRRKDVANKIHNQMRNSISNVEKYSSYPNPTDVLFWISGVDVANSQCGFMSSSDASIGTFNCNAMLPFICEKGTKPYQEPFLWGKTGIAVLIVMIVIVSLVLLLVAGWWLKSRRRKKEFFERKESIRQSARSKKVAIERSKEEQRIRQFQRQKDPIEVEKRPSTPDLIGDAHRKLVLGNSPVKKLDMTSTNSGSTDDSIGASYKSMKLKPTTPMSNYTNSESAYKSDYSPSNSNYTPSKADTVETSPQYKFPKVTRHDTLDSNAPSLSSFKSGPSGVVFRNGKKPKSNKRDTGMSESTGVTCSTCPTESVTSYDHSARGSRDSRTTAGYTHSSYTGSTVTERSARSSASDTTTLTDDNTIDDETSGIYAVPPNRTPTTESRITNEDPRHYLQGQLTPSQLNDWDHRVAGGSRPHIPPPPVPSLGSFPNLTGASAYSRTGDTRNLLGTTDSKSLNFLADPRGNNAKRTFQPPLETNL